MTTDRAGSNLRQTNLINLGCFHKWSVNYEEFETGPGNFGAVIVEDQKGAIHLIHVELVRFSPPEPESMMFKPKYFRINDTWHMFMVRPDVGELFTVSEISSPTMHEIARACQVQWISGRVVCSQGGIPLREIKTIFEEVNGE